MRKEHKKAYIELSIFVPLTIIILTIFSVPLLGIPPLGNLLIPGNGVWNVPGELPAAERLNIEGLRDEVTVIRDEWGIPHIYATYEEDMFFVQGYCQAQDRLFQMDMLRRQVRGKLSEILGVEYLSTDKFMLATGMETWAINTVNALEEMQQNGTITIIPRIERYVDGINYFINTHKQQIPLEYHLIGFEPTEWSTVDSMSIVQLMAMQLSWNYNDLYRYQNLALLGPTNYTELFGLPRPYQIPICPNYGSFGEIPMSPGVGVKTSLNAESAISTFIKGIEKIDSQKELIENQELTGSNNWVIDGVKSSTGYPILCNDMHLSWNMPGIWYEQHIVAEDTGFNAYGFQIPGMPLLAVGHNQYVGWGFTNTGYDVIDWYLFNTNGDDSYIYNNTPQEYTYKTYKVNVKDQGTIDFSVRHTVHGPVMSDLIGNFGIPGDIVISSKWTANNYFYTLLAANGFCRAKNRADFDNASQYWTTFAQNMVYGDIYGNIAIRPTGKVPIRDDPLGMLGNGTLPYNGSNGEGEWMGYIDILNELPNSFNPSQHYLASANQIVAGPAYVKYHLQSDYANGYRARRINELLNQSTNISVEDMKVIQNDVNSTAARGFVPTLIAVIKYEYGASPPSVIGDVLSELESWKYVMLRDLAAPTIYRKWRDYFMQYTFDELEGLRKPGEAVLEYLMKEVENSTWFDDISTPEVETRNQTMLIALNATIDWLTELYDSSTPSAWEWGEVHKLTFPHITGLASLSKGPYQGDGEGYTINPSGISLNDMNNIRYARGGASERMILDFSNLNQSLSVIPSGQRGLSNSKHYSDQLEQLFLQGKYHFQYYTNTPLNFPTNSFESAIYLYPKGGV
ncbi:MAG: penicillin acylase family protein [Promethearchaeota archaeon]|nr:MAG: penicillin acylase family protein [Candidatus Lokiarchaeota archaeon]